MVNKKGQEGYGVIIFFALIFLTGIVGIFLAMGFDSVDTGHYGVLTKFGEPVGSMGPGMKWTGLFVDVTSFDMRTRKTVLNINTKELAASDVEGQDVYGTVSVNYILNTKRIMELFNNVAKSDSEVESKMQLQEKVVATFKNVVVEYTAMEVLLKENEISQKVCERLMKIYDNSFITIQDCTVSNTDVNADFKAQIERRRVEEMKKIATEKERETLLIQNEIAVNNARAEKEKTIIAAEAANEQKILAADAEAYAIKARAEAEAEALRLKKQELTTMMVQNNWIDKWDGKLPMYQFGSDTNMLVSMPTSSN